MFTAKQNLIKEDGSYIPVGTEDLKAEDIGSPEVVERFLSIGAIEKKGAAAAGSGDKTEADLKKLSRAKVAEYAASKGVEVTEEDSKDEIIAKTIAAASAE